MKYIPQYLSRIIILLILFLPYGAFGEVPQIINYQGQLLTTGGQVVDGTKSITFCLYEAPTGGSNIWCETHPSVTVTDGSFNVALGSITSLSHLKFDVPYYLGITVEGDSEMTPRLALGSVPASLQAESVTGRAQTVDCGNGEKIMDALNAGATTVTVKGTCTEDVVITRNDVTLNADAGGGGITGAIAGSTGRAIFVNGAKRTTINDLVVQGNADQGNGIYITGGSLVTISGVTVQNSPAFGIFVGENSNLIITNSSISNNAGTALVVVGAATIGDANGDPGDVMISSNGFGMIVNKGTAFFTNTTIEDSNLYSILAINEGVVSIGDGNSITKMGGIPLPSIQLTSANLSQFASTQSTVTTNGDLGIPAISTTGHTTISLSNIAIDAGSSAAMTLGQFTSATFGTTAPDQSVDITGGSAVLMNNFSIAVFNNGVTLTGSVTLNNFASATFGVPSPDTVTTVTNGVTLNSSSSATFWTATVTGGVTCNGTRFEFFDNTGAFGGSIDSITGCTPP